MAHDRPPTSATLSPGDVAGSVAAVGDLYDQIGDVVWSTARLITEDRGAADTRAGHDPHLPRSVVFTGVHSQPKGRALTLLLSSPTWTRTGNPPVGDRPAPSGLGVVAVVPVGTPILSASTLNTRS